MKKWRLKFAVLGIGQAISILTSSIFQMAIVWYLTEKTASASVITFATLAGYLPQAIVGLFIGAFIDAHSRKKIVIFADLGIAMAAVVFALLAFNRDIPIGLVFLILAIRSIGNAFHTPSFEAIIPTIVPEDQLARCAGLLQGFESVSLLLSPAIAAVLFNIWTISMIAWIDVLGAAIAIIIMLIVKVPKNNLVQKKQKTHIFQDTKEGFAILKKKNGMLALLIISSLYAFIYFPIGSMYPLMTMNYFGGSIVDSSVVEIIFSAGTLLGALLLSLLGNKMNHWIAIACSIGIYGLGVMVSGLLPSNGLYVFMALSSVMGITLPFFYGLRTAIFQSQIPNEYLGRVLSLTYSISLFAAPLGLLFGGGFSEALGIQNCFLVLGILSIILAICIFVIPSMRLKHKKHNDH